MRSFFNRFLTNIKLLGFHSNRTEFYGDLAKAIEKKEPIRKFLEAELAISRDKKTANDSRAFALKAMLHLVRSGEEFSISKTIGRYMPKSDLMMLAAVDQSKDQPATLLALSAALVEQGLAKKVVLQALVTPLMLIPGMAAFAYVLSTQAIPVIEKTAPPEVWTQFNSAVRGCAHFISSYGIYTSVIAIVAVVIFGFSLSRWRSSLRFRMERINPKYAVWLTPVAPWLLPLAMYRDFQAGMMLSAMSVLLQTGKSLKESLEIVYANSSPWMRSHVRKILVHLHNYPTEYAKAFSKGLLSANLLARLATSIRNTPKFDAVLIEIGTKGNADVREQVRKSASKINMIFMLLAGSLVMFLYMGQMNITMTMQDEMDPVRRTQRKLEKQQSQAVQTSSSTSTTR